METVRTARVWRSPTRIGHLEPWSALIAFRGPKLSAVTDDPRRALAFEESTRALHTQSENLNDLRSRTGILLTGLALSASFLGARALDDSGFDTLNWIAMLLFGAAGFGCLLILLPWGDWRFTHDATRVLREFVDGDETLDAMHTEMAETNQANWKKNEVKLGRLQWLFRLAVLLLVLQVGFWLASLGHDHGDAEKTPENSQTSEVDSAWPQVRQSQAGREPGLQRRTPRHLPG